MEIKNRELFDNLMTEAMQKEFSGWDFSYIRDRWKDSPTSWDLCSDRSQLYYA